MTFMLDETQCNKNVTVTFELLAEMESNYESSDNLKMKTTVC